MGGGLHHDLQRIEEKKKKCIRVPLTMEGKNKVVEEKKKKS